MSETNNIQSPSTSEKKEGIFSLTVAIFIVPTYVYLCSYVFELGICSYYGIPKEFIKPDLTTNLYYSISIFLVLGIVYFFPQAYIYHLFYNKLQKKPQNFPYFSFNTGTLILILAYCKLAAFRFDGKLALVVCLTLIVLANILAYIVVRYFNRNMETRSYEDVAATWDKESKARSLIDSFPDVWGLSNLFGQITQKQRKILLLFLGIIFVSYLFGQSEAYETEYYLRPKSQPNYLLLRKYGDDFILKNYDPKTNRLGDSLILIKAGDGSMEVLVRIKTGNLVPEKGLITLPKL